MGLLMKNDTKGLDFHQTFKPERNCLISLLADLSECSGKTAQEISKITGIPTGASSGKVVPSICYLEYMGLINAQLSNKRYELEYTYLGNGILVEDPGLIEDLTLLLLHCMITRKRSGADLWSYIITDLLPKYHGRINKSNFDKELEFHYGKEVNLAPFNGTYTGLLDQLGLLKISNGGYSMQGHTLNKEFIYLYAYVFYEYWNEWLDGFSPEEKEKRKVSETEITANQIEETGFRLPFGWSEQDEYSVLEMMHDRSIISLNRQMTPFAARKLRTEEEVIDLLYSELC